MELWELVAREQIRDTIARYNWAGDGMRLDELAEAFCDGAELVIRGRAPIVGRPAILDFFRGLGGGQGGAGPTIVRHVVTNTRFVEVTPERAKVESYFTVLTDIGLDHYGRYRDEHVPDGDGWRIERRQVRTDWRADGSLMASPGDIAGATPEAR